MQNKRFTRLFSASICAVLIAVMVLLTVGCDNSSGTSSDSSPVKESTAPQQSQSSSVIEASSSSQADALEVKGEGKTSFVFASVDLDGKETKYKIYTDQNTVGKALTALELIAGDSGEYGLYVKTVNGVTLDYDKDKKYWAFYVDGEYATKGVDSTEIKEGSTYSFKPE